MDKGYLAVIEEIGNALLNKDLEISILKYENENLKAKIKSIEDFANNASKKKEIKKFDLN